MKSRQILAAIILFIVVAVLGYRIPTAAAERIDLYQTMDPLTDILFFIDKKFYRDIDEEDLRLGAIQGMLETLDAAALAERRPVTRALAQRLLDNLTEDRA